MYDEFDYLNKKQDIEYKKFQVTLLNSYLKNHLNLQYLHET
ncbi:hypothetical protein MPR_1358 [Myroides profundi]|nr:hypothetical protein MPR_1358 [Myroides profundi]